MNKKGPKDLMKPAMTSREAITAPHKSAKMGHNKKAKIKAKCPSCDGDKIVAKFVSPSFGNGRPKDGKNGFYWICLKDCGYEERTRA